MSTSTPSGGAQTPSSDESTTRQTPPTSGQTPTTPHSDDDEPMSVAEAKKLRDENKQRRLAHEATLTELKKIQDAQLSEQEKQSKRLAELQSKEATWAEERQRMLLERAVEREAASLFNDPEDVMHYLDLSLIDYNDDGRPKNLPKVLRDLAADLEKRGKTHLLKSEQGSQPTQPGQRQSLGASNPSRSQTSGTGELTWDTIGRMTKAEFDARDADGSLSKWMATHPVRPRPY